MTDKICPLMTPWKDSIAYCQENKCALWDEETDQCALLSLAQSLGYIQASR